MTQHANIPSAPAQPSIVQQLDQCTVRIATDDGRVATGFFFSEPNPAMSGAMWPIIITNRHVIEEASRIQLVISIVDGDGSERHVEVDEPLATFDPLYHPSGEIDLAGLNIASALTKLESPGSTFRFRFLDRSVIPPAEEFERLTVATNIIMIGYPNGIWDDVNNKAVFRRGIAATSPARNWQGRQEFLIDMAVYAGSSGSPVFAYDEGSFATQNGIQFGSRLYLLGVNQGVYGIRHDGVLRLAETPDQIGTIDAVAETEVPMNLGVCINALTIDALLRELPKPRMRYSAGGYRITIS